MRDGIGLPAFLGRGDELVPPFGRACVRKRLGREGGPVRVDAAYYATSSSRCR